MTWGVGGRAVDHLESSDALKSQLRTLLMDGTSECKLTLTETHPIGGNAPRLAAAPGWRLFLQALLGANSREGFAF